MTDSVNFDIDEWLKVVLSSIDQMVAVGDMPKEQADEMRARVPMVRAKHFGEGPADWVDASIGSWVRNLQKSDLPELEKKKLCDELREPQYLAMLRIYGPPEWLGIKRSIGEHGKYAADSCTAEEIETMAKHARDAREATDRLFRSTGRDAGEYRIKPSEMDAQHAAMGQQAMLSCERFGKRADRWTEFLEALELQALSISQANREFTATMFGDDCAMKSIQADAMWAQNGFPFVRITDAKWCASLCATSVPPELAEMIREPWSSFRVAIPQGLLSIDLDDGSGDAEDCTRMMVSRDAIQEWTIVLFGETKMMHITGEKTSGLCEEIPIEKTNITKDPGFRQTGRDGRVLRLACRLVLSICMSMAGEDSVARKSVKRVPGNRRGVPEPVLRNYVLRPPVRVRTDVRPAIKTYLSGKKGNAPSVQYVVRGHWKHQRSGPGGTERKFIHIEPYWRGPEDAPIAVRPHILKGPKSGNENDGGQNAAE